MAITTRAGKGSPLTHTEMDGNITAIPELTSSTGVVKGASGTTAQRPATAVAGYTRFNTTIGRHETYSGSAWIEDVNTALKYDKKSVILLLKILTMFFI